MSAMPIAGSPNQTDTKAKAREALEKLVSDVSNQREEIDKVNHNISYLAEELTKTNAAVNKQTELIEQIITKGQIKVSSDNPQMNNITALKELLDSKLGEKLIDRIFPAEPTGTGLLSAETINAHLQKSMLGNFELGEALVDQLKTKVIGKALTKTVSEIISHEPA